MSHFNESLTRRLTVTRYVKGPRFINERHRKGVPYFVKNVLQRVTGLDLGMMKSLPGRLPVSYS